MVPKAKKPVKPPETAPDDPTTTPETGTDPAELLESPVTRSRVIVIDPGHGLPDPGAVGPGGLTEEETNLKIGVALKDKLKAQGYKVIMTRYDHRVSGGVPLNVTSFKKIKSSGLRHRVEISKSYSADLFISIHCNAATSQQAHGFEVFHNKRGAADAVLVYEAMKAAMPDHKPRRCEPAKFYVLRKNHAPAILVECEFLSNPGQERWLRNPSTVALLAEAVAQGVLAGEK